jgi:hypothetical protein
MPGLDENFLAALAKLLTPALRLIEPAYMKFLIVLAGLLCLFFAATSPRALTGKASVVIAICLFAFLGCGMQVYEWRVKAELKRIDAFKETTRALNEEKRKLLRKEKEDKEEDKDQP